MWTGVPLDCLTPSNKCSVVSLPAYALPPILILISHRSQAVAKIIWNLSHSFHLITLPMLFAIQIPVSRCLHKFWERIFLKIGLAIGTFYLCFLAAMLYSERRFTTLNQDPVQSEETHYTWLLRLDLCHPALQECWRGWCRKLKDQEACIPTPAWSHGSPLLFPR